MHFEGDHTLMNPKPITKKAKRQARKLFAKPQHSTRQFTSEDYKALPKGE